MLENFIEGKLLDIKGQVDSNTIIEGNTLLTPIDKSS